MNFRHIPEPQLGELVNYTRQRQDQVVMLASTADVRNEITRNVTDRIQPVDQYPKGRQFLQDEDYLLILKDLLNLSNILDDMEQTGFVPYQKRSSYFSESQVIMNTQRVMITVSQEHLCMGHAT